MRHDDSQWASTISKSRGKCRVWGGPKSGDHVSPHVYMGDKKTLWHCNEGGQVTDVPIHPCESFSTDKQPVEFLDCDICARHRYACLLRVCRPVC